MRGGGLAGNFLCSGGGKWMGKKREKSDTPLRICVIYEHKAGMKAARGYEKINPNNLKTVAPARPGSLPPWLR